jgi:hypothetical protein
MPRLVDRTSFIKSAKKLLGSTTETVTRAQVTTICDKYGLDWPNWMTTDPRHRVSRGVYSFERVGSLPPKSDVEVKSTKAKTISTAKSSMSEVPMMAEMAVAAVALNNPAPINLVPEKVSGYVPFGNFSDVRAVIKSRKFYPMYITGLSGNGKTMMVEQVCAAEKREMIRVNITIETDEDDLIGGFRLQDGKTVWQNGPVIVAMERGAVLLLDEVDLGSNKMMCLQPVLEGKPIYLKKINKVITPMPGFTVVATANTKGKGSEDGRFIGTNVQNEAFLERFSVTLEQEYPSIKIEQKIVNNVLASNGIEDNQFAERIVAWADVIRKSFYEGAVSEIISTRRLVHICEAYSIFGQNREKAISFCLNRFDVDTKNSFLDLYKKLDETINPLPAQNVTPNTEEVAF